MFFLYSKWLQTPLPIRVQIASKFNIEKKGATEVFNNEIIKDGYLIKDIENAITTSSLQDFLDTEEADAFVLWNMLISKINTPEVNQITSIISPEEVTRMNKEYEDRTGNIAPLPQVETKKEPMNIDELANTVNENAKTPNLSDVIKKKGRPKGSKKVDGKWVYPEN